MFTQMLNLLLPFMFGEETGTPPPKLDLIRISQVTLGYFSDTDARTHLPDITIFTPGTPLSTLTDLTAYGFTPLVASPFAFSWTSHGGAFEKLSSVQLYHQVDPQKPAVSFNSTVPQSVTGDTDFAGYRLNVKVEVRSDITGATMSLLNEGGKNYLYFALPYNFQPTNLNSLAFLNANGVPVLFVITPVSQVLDNGDSAYITAYLTFDPTFILNPDTANIDLVNL